MITLVHDCGVLSAKPNALSKYKLEIQLENGSKVLFEGTEPDQIQLEAMKFIIKLYKQKEQQNG